jgi:hypothetical protein
VWSWGIEAMQDGDDDFEAGGEEDAKVEFANEIADEPLVPPPKPVSRIRKLSFSFVTLLLLVVAVLNLAMIVWFLLR